MTDEALAAAAVRLATGRARMQPADRDDALQDARLAIWQAHDLYDELARTNLPGAAFPHTSVTGWGGYKVERWSVA